MAERTTSQDLAKELRCSTKLVLTVPERKHGFDMADAARELVERTTRAQGLPRRIEDPAVVARLATLVRVARPTRHPAA